MGKLIINKPLSFEIDGDQAIVSIECEPGQISDGYRCLEIVGEKCNGKSVGTRGLACSPLFLKTYAAH